MPGSSYKISAEVRQFTSALKSAQQSVKTLDAELKLSQAQYKATGDAESYAASQSRILSDQLAAQQRAADAAQGAMDALAAEGQQDSDTFMRFKRSLYDAQTEMTRLRSSSDRLDDSLDDTADSADAISGALNRIGQATGITALVSGFSQIKGYAQAVVNFIQEQMRLSKEYAEWADNLSTQSQQHGISTEELQRWQWAARHADVEVDTLLKARDKLLDDISGAQNGYITITDGINQFAVAVTDAAGETRDSMDVFWDFIDVLKEVENVTERDALAQKYFGKNFRELTGLIEIGREGWQGYAEEAQVVSDSAVDILAAYNDYQDDLQAERDARKREAHARGILWTSTLNHMLGIGGDIPDELIDKDLENGINKTLTVAGNLAEYGALAAGYGLLKLFGAGGTGETAAPAPGDENFVGPLSPAEMAELEARAASGGTELGAAALEGMAETEDAFAAAGAALGAAALRGLSGAAGGGGTVNNNNQQYIENVQLGVITSAKDVLATVNALQKSAQKGVGG